MATYTPKYTSLDDIKRLLRSARGKIKISAREVSETTQDDISEKDVLAFIAEIEGKMDVTISQYSIPLTNVEMLRYIATRLACYEIYGALYPEKSFMEVPQRVKDWKKDAEDNLEQLKTSSNVPGAFCSEWGEQL